MDLFLWNDKTLEYEKRLDVFEAFRAYAGMGNFANFSISKTPPKMTLTNTCAFCDTELEEECCFFTCPLVECVICKICGDGTGLGEVNEVIQLYKLKIVLN